MDPNVFEATLALLVAKAEPLTRLRSAPRGLTRPEIDARLDEIERLLRDARRALSPGGSPNSTIRF
jgi:hypothetical protein